MIDKRTLIDSVFVQKKLADDKWGKPVFDKPILLSPVRFDRVYSHEGTGNNRTDTKNRQLFWSIRSIASKSSIRHLTVDRLLTVTIPLLLSLSFLKSTLSLKRYFVMKSR